MREPPARPVVYACFRMFRRRARFCSDCGQFHNASPGRARQKAGACMAGGLDCGAPAGVWPGTGGRCTGPDWKRTSRPARLLRGRGQSHNASPGCPRQKAGASYRRWARDVRPICVRPEDRGRAAAAEAPRRPLFQCPFPEARPRFRPGALRPPSVGFSRRPLLSPICCLYCATPPGGFTRGLHDLQTWRHKLQARPGKNWES